MKCNRSIVLLTLALTLVLVPISLAQAKKPLIFEVSGVSTSYGWIGTVDSGPLAGNTMIWYTHVVMPRGQTVYFFETWEIRDVDTDALILFGYDEGVMRLNNGEGTGNGKVLYAQEGPFEYLLGCKEHFTGTLTGPTTFTGTVQIN